jgi:multiple sugar transport system substrate-binding protein
MYGGTGLGINATASEDGQKAAWLFVVWATAKQTQLQNLKSEVGGGTPTLQSVYEIPEVVEARERPSKIPNILTYNAIEEAWKGENIGLRPKIPAWNECDTRMFTALSKMLASGGDPQKYMQQAKDGMEQAIENAKALA